MKHPNATTSLAGGAGLGTLLVYGLGVAGIDLPPEAAAAIASAVGAAVLFVGRNGLIGAWKLLLRGTSTHQPR